LKRRLRLEMHGPPRKAVSPRILAGLELAEETGMQAAASRVPGGSIVTQLSRVLAAVDFSQPARRAFEYALALSQRHHAELVVVHAVRPDEAFSRHGRQRLALMMKLRRQADKANVVLRERVQQGDPATIILLHAQTLRPDVIVMGTDQRGMLDRLRSGSVCERVTLRASTPVLLIPPCPAGGAVPSFRHVAVAVDFSASSERAVEHAATLADDPASRLTMLHVVPRVVAESLEDSYRLGLADHQEHLMRDDQDHLIDKADARLRVAAGRMPDTRATVDTRVLVGKMVDQLNLSIDRLGADHLVVGVPRRGVVSRALFGTTATRLLRVIGVPMLAVPEMSRAIADRAGVSARAAA
jgi:nucleotide-binding universal stress UspA family protein